MRAWQLRLGVLTFVVLVFAEVLPKTIAALYPEKVAYPSSFLLAPLQILMMPAGLVAECYHPYADAHDGYQNRYRG
ncbi:inner membrane protein, UPF0053 family [Escherichia coli]|uniref:Inner membrane protein, UPF0053 family n=1 Tax=Escherichia coli TaxID=562 RepID=A0A376KNS9_ECOLX|nr:inner membrane protein, UPF0053 family [Escherichia coli]